MGKHFDTAGTCQVWQMMAPYIQIDSAMDLGSYEYIIMSIALL